MLFEPLLANTTRVVICGEVSSGKSTLLNALMRRKILPDNIGAATHPAVSVAWAGKANITATFPDGVAQSMAPGGGDALRGAEQIVVRCNAQHMRPYELIELPMTTAEALGDDHFDTVASADVLIWVTIASQAWRLTERSILDELADVRPKRGIIAISRADKLRLDADREKLMERMRSETEDYFDAANFMFGSRDLVAAAALSRPAWDQTGAPAILSRIKDLMEAGEASEVITHLQDHQNTTVGARKFPKDGASVPETQTVSPALAGREARPEGADAWCDVAEAEITPVRRVAVAKAGIGE